MTFPAFDENTNITDASIPSDVLVSKQFLTVLDLLGEGIISGFPSATGSQGSAEYNTSSLKDVFLNGTQVLNQSAGTSPADSDFNFPNVSFEPRFGTSNQTSINAITQTESELGVGVVVEKDTPVSRDITDSNVNAVRVTLTFPSLQKFEDNGDINGAEVQLNIQTISGGTTNTVITDTVRGRTQSAYSRDYKITFGAGASFPITIRVNRLTDDSTDTKLQNTMIWSNMTEIINDASTFPNSAYAALRIDAETFPSIPRRTYRVRGTKISIPHNGTVRADGSISYSGVFNGTLKGTKEYSNDPAWILYDLLTTSKGFGDHVTASQLDIFSFYSASVYCSELIDSGNGNGTVEPRFSCNVVLQNQKQAYSLINDLCSVMRVMPFYSAGTITIGQDRPTDPTYLFNLSNVTEAGFTYANSSKSTKVTVVNVSYFDMETRQIDYETSKDDALIAKYGVVTKNLRGFATTSRGMAARLGRWYLYTQSNEAEIVTFTTTLESGTIVRPSAVISIQDPLRAGIRRGGRIATGVSTTQIIVDDENNTDLSVVGTDATLSVILADGSLETKSISSISGKTISIDGAFSSVPKKNSVWMIENNSVKSQLFKVISVVEVEKIGYQITAVAHNSGKYDAVEDGTVLPTRTITTLTALPLAPSNLQATEQIVVINNRAVSKLFITFQPVAGVTDYQIQYRFNNENFIINNIKSPDFTIFETQNGVYEIRVFSINAIKKPSALPTTISVTTVGKTALPEDITNLTAEPVSDQFIRLRFTQSPDVDVIHGGNIVVRHTPEVATVTATFENSTDVIPALSGNISETLVPALSGTYSVKARDDGGRFSQNEATIVVTRPEAQPLLGIQTRREDTDSPPFQGEKTSVFYDSTFDGLLLTGTTLFDAVTDFDSLASVDFAGPISSTGTYEFASPLDLGAVFVLNLQRIFKTAGLLVNDLFDTRTGLIDTWTDFDGAKANAVNAVLQVATTQADPAATVTGTYVYSGLFVTITKSSHGFSDNDHFIADFTSGSGIDGEFKVSSVTNENVFVAEKVDNPTSISSSGNVTFGVAFTRFNNFINGESKARGFKFRALLSTTDPAQNINVSEMGYVASFKPREENSIENSGATNGVFASGTNTKTITFQHPFFVGTVPINGSASKFLPSIGITLQNAQKGDFFTVHTITGTNFQIDVKDENENFVNRNFTYIASGFGKGG